MHTYIDTWSVHIFVYCTVHCTVHCTVLCTRDPYPGRSPKERAGLGVYTWQRCTACLYYPWVVLPLGRTPGRGGRPVRHSGTGAASRARGGQPCRRRSRWAQGKKGGWWLAKQGEAPKQVRRVRVRTLACVHSACVVVPR